MKPLETSEQGSTSDKEETPRSRMQKPPIHTTKYGTQYVNVLDIIQSEDGWAEIERLRDANLVRRPALPKNGTSSESSSSNEGDVS